MEGKKSKPRAILVFGAPCSGKTTFAEKFAQKFDLAYYDLDEIKESNRLTHKNILLILKLIVKTGKNIIIEGNLSTEKDRLEIRNILREAGYVSALVWVQTDIATIRVRMKSRYHEAGQAKEIYTTKVESMEAPSELEHPIILSGKHTFDTQAKHVLSGLADAAKR